VSIAAGVVGDARVRTVLATLDVRGGDAERRIADLRGALDSRSRRWFHAD
jgi:hypothetical protein